MAACFILLFLITSAGLVSLIVINLPIQELRLDRYRITAIAILSIIFTLSYAYSIVSHKEIRKLFLTAVSLGAMVGSTIFIVGVLYCDLHEIFKTITMLSTFEKCAVLENYFSIHYIQFLPCLFFMCISNLIRVKLRGKFNSNEKTSGILGTA